MQCLAATAQKWRPELMILQKSFFAAHLNCTGQVVDLREASAQDGLIYEPVNLHIDSLQDPQITLAGSHRVRELLMKIPQG